MFQSFMALIKQLAMMLLVVLPLSPFQQYIEDFEEIPYLGYLNWFLPIGDCFKVGIAWLSVIALFYLYSVALRWIKLIEG